MIFVAPVFIGLLSVLLYVRSRMLGVHQTNRVLVLSPSLRRSSAGRQGSHSFLRFVDVFRGFHHFFGIPPGSWETCHITPWFCSLLNQTLHVVSAVVCNLNKLLTWGLLDLSTDLGLLSLFIESLIRNCSTKIKVKCVFWIPPKIGVIILLPFSR